MKSNLFFFCFVFFLAPFRTGKNENTWSRQAKFVEVDPTQKIIFLSAFSSLVCEQALGSFGGKNSEGKGKGCSQANSSRFK